MSWCNIIKNLLLQIPGLVLGGYITFYFGKKNTKIKIAAERKNNTTEDILNVVDKCQCDTQKWIKEVYLCKKNTDQEDDHFKAYQIRNILDNLNIVEKKALRLSNNDLNNSLSKLSKLIKGLISALQKRFWQGDKNLNLKGMEYLDEAPEKLKSLCESIRKQLKN
ncbi:hypothetical protein ACFLYU_05860 [Candidatus Dependentiae bacterium]